MKASHWTWWVISFRFNCVRLIDIPWHHCSGLTFLKIVKLVRHAFHAFQLPLLSTVFVFLTPLTIALLRTFFLGLLLSLQPQFSPIHCGKSTTAIISLPNICQNVRDKGLLIMFLLFFFFKQRIPGYLWYWHHERAHKQWISQSKITPNFDVCWGN